MKSRETKVTDINIVSVSSNTITAKYDPNSKHYIKTVKINNALQGAGTDLPVLDSLYKGQESYNCERELLDHLNAELINLRGFVGEYYVTSYDNTADKFFGEDGNPLFLRKFDFMYISDEVIEPDFSYNMWSIWADNTYLIDIAKRHFLVASTKASTQSHIGSALDSGFQVDQSVSFESIQPKNGDVIKMKNTGMFFEITNVKNRYTSLQGSSFWSVTIKLMKNVQMEVSDEYGMKDKMIEVQEPSITSQKFADVFDLTKSVKETADDIKYNNDKDDTGDMDAAWGTNSFWDS